MDYVSKYPQELTETETMVDIETTIVFTDSRIPVGHVKFTNVPLEIVNEAIAHINDNC